MGRYRGECRRVPRAAAARSQVRKDGGQKGTKKYISPAVRSRLEEKWACVLAAPTGCKTYDEFRQTVKK